MKDEADKQDASIAMPRGKTGTDTIQISTDIYVSEVSLCIPSVEQADKQTKLEDDPKYSVNRGPPYSGSSSGDDREEDLGKESTWSPTTWDDRRKAEPGRMV